MVFSPWKISQSVVIKDFPWEQRCWFIGVPEQIMNFSCEFPKKSRPPSLFPNRKDLLSFLVHLSTKSNHLARVRNQIQAGSPSTLTRGSLGLSRIIFGQHQFIKTKRAEEGWRCKSQSFLHDRVSSIIFHLQQRSLGISASSQTWTSILFFFALFNILEVASVFGL